MFIIHKKVLTFVYKGTIMKPLYNHLEKSMATNITVKNIPQDLYEKIKRRADLNHRSINREIIAIFEEVLAVRRINPEDILISARELRERTRGIVLTQEFIDRAKKEGRP
jgi:plasmid stability protein